jgi:hypothetical protein
MNQIERQLQTMVEQVRLTDKEKTLMRERLVSYMEHKPLRAPAVSRSQPVSIPFFTFFRAHHISGALTVALLATVSTFGVSSAADDALPGDLLYPVKVNVNEEIKTVLLGSEEEELLWESKRAELRLQEASQLAAEGRLDTERQEEVSKLLAEHTDAVNEKVHAMEESDPALVVEVSSDLEAALGAHEAVLARLIVEQEGEGPEENPARGLVEQVRTAAIEAGKAREGAEQIIVGEESPVDVAAVPVTGDEPAPETGAEQGEQPGEGIIPSADSANMRERAVYRAHVRATESLAQARELVMALDQDSDIARQSMTQIAVGERMMAEGTAALADHNLGAAYGSYRKADTVFQKVGRLLEALTLFSSLEILTETVVEELPDAGQTVVASTTPTDIVDEAAQASAMRDEVEHMLAETRSLLLTVNGFDEDVVVEVNALMKDAMAHVMRGDIALVLGDETNATKLLTRARAKAERALDIVSDAVRELGGVNVVVPAEQTHNDEAPAFALTHRFEDGTHVWTGTIDVPTPCAVLETGALVAESYPEQVTLTFNVVEQASAPCVQMVSVRSFEIRAGASAEATLTGVQVNGVNRTWAVTEG